jgi:hypothetical protein
MATEPLPSNERVHELKCWPEFFRHIADRSKSFECRWNDRRYKIGDMLHIREFDPDKETYTGAEAWRRVTYILRGTPGARFGLNDGWAILGLSHETNDGYKDAFYQIATLLDMEAMPISPKDAFERFMLPKLRALVARETADKPVAWRKLINNAYERHPRYGYSEEEFTGGEPLYTRATEKTAAHWSPEPVFLTEDEWKTAHAAWQDRQRARSAEKTAAPTFNGAITLLACPCGVAASGDGIVGWVCNETIGWRCPKCSAANGEGNL